MHKHAYTYIYTCIYMHAYTYTYTYADIHIYACSYTLIHTHTYTDTYNMYICTHASTPGTTALQRLPWLAHDEAPGPYITILQYRFNKTKQHTLREKPDLTPRKPRTSPLKVAVPPAVACSQNCFSHQ